MSLKSLIGFENLFSKQFGKDIFKQPTRLLTGIDPASTKVWNKVLGRDDKALVNPFGSPGEQYYQQAEAKGIDTGSARGFHKAADMVAAYYGAQGLAGIGGGSGAAASGGGEAASGGGLGSSAAAEPNSKASLIQAMVKSGMGGLQSGAQQPASQSRPLTISDGTPLVSSEAERIRREQVMQAMLAQTKKGFV